MLHALLDNLRLALGTFAGNPLRSALTLLGIVIGAATVVTMMGVIEGLRVKVHTDLSALGAHTFQVRKFPGGFGHQDRARLSRRPDLTLEDRRAIAELPSVLAAAAEDRAGGQRVATAGRETRADVSVWAGTPELVHTHAIAIAAGRMFSEAESLDGRQVAVLGPDVVDTLFPAVSPLGQEVRLKGRPFEVVGVLERRGAFLGGPSQDNLVLVPLSAFTPLYGRERSLDLSVQARGATALARAQDEVVLLMRRRHGLAPGEPDDFSLASNESATATFEQLSRVISVATFGVCLLSLVVGGIGILNIMLVSVTERTREVGIRKALGARRSRILAQFATEAVLLALSGGVIGVAAGEGLAALARWLLGVPAAVPGWAVALALGMSSGVGLLFGIYPAVRASRLDPVEAMRAE